MERRSLVSALMAMTLLMSACGTPATAGLPIDADSPASTTLPIEAEIAGTSQAEATKLEATTDFVCPVTFPLQPGFVATIPDNVTYSEHFPAPEPWPSEYPHDAMVWHGTEELWTALAVDGDHGGRKSVWWSVNFPGGIEEEQPEVSVTWTRLDTKEPIVIDNGDMATNAFTQEEGWFMIAGIDPSQSGCWKVEATYKGTSHSYVYERP